MTTVAEYLRSKEAVRGWLQDIDARVILAIDELQRSADFGGDLLEIGVFYGRSAILLGYCAQNGERLMVCDTFEDTNGFGAENLADHERYYKGLRRREFEANYLRYHPALPEIITAPSVTIDRDQLAGRFRIVHIDGSHVYSDVREDIVTARRLLGPGGVVILDDWSQAHVPGVALAIWEEYSRGELIPLGLTQFKMYASWDPHGLSASALNAWARSDGNLEISEGHQLAQYEVRRYSLTPSTVSSSPSPRRGGRWNFKFR
jgi:SAM-dependent methyltransferase